MRQRDDLRNPWLLLLTLPFVGLLWVPFYNSVEPRLFNFPFFYWYQFCWLVLTTGLISIVFKKTS